MNQRPSGHWDRTRAEELHELAQDLAATWNIATEPNEVASWMSRPSILRRVAGSMAEWIAPDVDRILAEGHGSIALGSALALATGLPYCALEGGVRFGPLHDGESVVIVSAVAGGNALERPAAVLVVDRLSVVDVDPGQGRVGVRSLFALDTDGSIVISERKAS